MKPRDLRDKALALHDAALHSIHRIEALAGLMTAATGSRDSPLDGREIEEATSIIREETSKVRDTFASMRRLVDSAKARGKISTRAERKGLWSRL